jgi:MYXO-CTERM domain-containing protein
MSRRTAAGVAIALFAALQPAQSRAEDCGAVTQGGTANATNQGACPGPAVCPPASTRCEMARQNSRSDANTACQAKKDSRGKQCKLGDPTAPGICTYQCQGAENIHTCTTSVTQTYECKTSCSAMGAGSGAPLPWAGVVIALAGLLSRRRRRSPRA